MRDEGTGAFLTNLEHDRDLVVCTPGPLTSPHLKYHTAKTPYVDFGTVDTILVRNDLRCHPINRSLHCSVSGVAIYVICMPSDAKICDLADPTRIKQDVVSFQVLQKQCGQNTGPRVKGRFGHTRCNIPVS